MTRAQRFFGDILPPEAFARKVLPKDDDADLAELMWEAFNGRGKRASKKVEHEETSDDYIYEDVDYSKIRASKRMPRKELNALMEFINS